MRCEKDLKHNKDNSLYLGRNILGYLSLPFVAHSFPRALLSENCSLLGTDNVHGQKYPSMFSCQLKAIVYLYNNQINAHALIGQSAVGYCASKPTEKLNVF